MVVLIIQSVILLEKIQKGVDFLSKVICKMSFKHPNFKDSTSKNISHIGYIATRSGVDKTISEQDLEKELHKEIVGGSDNKTYVNYIDKRTNSHGLFGQEGIVDPKKIQNEIRKVDSFVWRSIVSLREEDAEKIGFLSKGKWQDMLRKKVPDMAHEMGIGFTNLKWCAAIHMEKGHPHAHVVFWEREPKKTVGIISVNSLNKIKKLYTDEIFEEERLQLLLEKNISRDILRDLAGVNISNIARILKSDKQNEKIKIGVAPRLYSEQENELINKLQALSKSLPGKGRVNFKFMSEEIKEEVDIIADYLLKQPEFSASLTKNLISVEKLTRMYTGKDEAIKKAMENTHNDIKKRISQIILRAAVEVQRENIFVVDDDLACETVVIIKNMNNRINLATEHTKVLKNLCFSLIKIGEKEEHVLETLNNFAKRESINCQRDRLLNILKQVKEDEDEDEAEVITLSTTKTIDKHLSVLKLSGNTEEEVFEKTKKIIEKDSRLLEKKFRVLSEKGFFWKIRETYLLTDKGKTELLKIKELDLTEKEIFKFLETKEIQKNIGLDDFLKNKNIFSSLRDKDPEEFKIGHYDVRVRDEFGHKNKITLKELENNIYERYTDNELNTNIEKAEQEIDMLKYRINKLTLNGYVFLDKKTGAYSFVNEMLDFFKYDEEKEKYMFTAEGKEAFDISNKMEFTRYDANVTLSYIDNSKDKILTKEDLSEVLHKEILNKTAERYFHEFSEILSTDFIETTKKYVSIDSEGNLSSTKEGNLLGIELNKLKYYFKESKGLLDDKKLKEICKTDEKFRTISNTLHTQIKKGFIEKNEDTGFYKIKPDILSTKNLLYQIYKEGGSLKQADIRAVLEKNIPNYEAKKQVSYICWRLDNLKEQDYLKGEKDKYEITTNGAEKREDILVPERRLLDKTVSYLVRLGLISVDGNGYKNTDEYYKYKEILETVKENKLKRESSIFSNEIAKVVDRTQNNVDVGKIERNGKRILVGKYINDEYEEIKTTYDDIRSVCGISDTKLKTIKNLSTMLLVSGANLKETTSIIESWNARANKMPTERLKEIIDKAHDTVKENNLWDKTTLISTKEWKETFESLGFTEEETPKWMFRGENWENFNKAGLGLVSSVNKMWQGVWNALRKQEKKTEMDVIYASKKQTKDMSKAAKKEQNKKQKSSGMFHEEEME